MAMNQEHIKLIFGIKLKELRNAKKLSLSDLSQKTGISQSYLNEIEKGKKYPKSDKIYVLAEALDVDYDELVSLKVSNKLQPLAILLQSNFLTEIPFDFFGVEPSNLLSLMADAPDKLGAFINAIINIGRNYNMSVENFHHAAMRSYQEMHSNYFENIEIEAKNFSKKLNGLPTEQNLTDLLKDEYGVVVRLFDEEDFALLADIRSVFRPKTNELLVNKRISGEQRMYTIAREIGFNFMALKPRALSSQAVDSQSFEEVLNSFNASYFASAIILPQSTFLQDVKAWFSTKKWNERVLESFIKKYYCTPETLFYRLSNLLPKFFGINSTFFMRFESISGSNEYWLTKEMHLARRLGPQEKVDEHYCRRWVSIGILENLAFKQSIGKYAQPLVAAQRSHLKENGTEYFIMSMARPLNIQKQKNVSVNIGFEINDNIRKKIAFVNDTEISEMKVNQTCERCSIFDCQVRQTAPIVLQEQRRQKELVRIIEEMS